MAGNESGLEHHMAQQTSPASDGSFAAHSAAIVCNRRKASECGGLLTCDLSQFGHLSNQHGTGDRTDTGNRPQYFSSQSEFIIRGDGLLNLCFKSGNLPIQKAFQLGVHSREHVR